jgi:hypothetical protein
MATATANAAQRKSKVGRVRSASLILIWRSAYQKQAALTISLPAKNSAVVKAFLRSGGEASMPSATRGVPSTCVSMRKNSGSTFLRLRLVRQLPGHIALGYKSRRFHSSGQAGPAAASLGSNEPRRTVPDRRPREKIELLADGLAQLRERGGRLFLLGVGGSAGNCSHAVNDSTFRADRAHQRRGLGQRLL